MSQLNLKEFKYVAITAGAILLFLPPSNSGARADLPHVMFDVGYMIACRDVTPGEFTLARPSDRLVKANIQVSSLIHQGTEDDLIELLYRMESRQTNIQIVDYHPKTTLTTDLAGNIDIEKSQEGSKSLGVAVTGSYEYVLKATPSANIRSKDSSTIRYELLPPKDLLASSGTMGRRQGVYFKLKPSPRTSLEGGKQFVVVLQVPRCWRGGLLYIRCRARGYERGVVSQLDEQRPCGASDFIVALYMKGDQEANVAAEQYVNAELKLRRAAMDNRDEILQRSYPTWAHKFGSILSAVQPKIPPNWLDRLIYTSEVNSRESYEQRLPQQIRTAVSNYQNAKSRLLQLSGQGIAEFDIPDQEH